MSLSAEEDKGSNALAAAINQKLQENAENKLRAFLNRSWVRRDGTWADGLRITVHFSNGNNFATVDEDLEYFARDDIKWREIQFVDANTFRFEDLAKSEFASSYSEAIGRINFEENKIEVSVTTAGEVDDFLGSNQILVPFVE